MLTTIPTFGNQNKWKVLATKSLIVQCDYYKTSRYQTMLLPQGVMSPFHTPVLHRACVSLFCHPSFLLIYNSLHNSLHRTCVSLFCHPSFLLIYNSLHNSLHCTCVSLFCHPSFLLIYNSLHNSLHCTCVSLFCHPSFLLIYNSLHNSLHRTCVSLPFPLYLLLTVVDLC